MHPDDIAGSWQLVGRASSRADADTDGAAAQWLDGIDDTLADRAVAEGAASGLLLAIAPDGTFTERASGPVALPWFDAEGVLQAQAEPFDGRYAIDRDRAALQPDRIPGWATPVAGRHGAARLRYDDGDTQVADHVRRRQELLVRTVSVVTDGAYLDRTVLVYARSR